MSSTTSVMQSIDNNELTSLVVEFDKLLTEFYELLEHEAEAIKSNDTAALTASNQNKTSHAEKVNAAATAIEKALPESCANLIDLSLDEGFSSLPQNLQQHIKEAINLTVKCYDKNVANGMSIQILSNINQNAIDTLTGNQNKDVKLYGASGETTSQGAKKSLGKA